MTIRFPILRWIICSSLSILSAALAGSLLLQGYLAIWHPSSFGRFTEFPAILLYAVWITTTAFLVLVAPIHF